MKWIKYFVYLLYVISAVFLVAFFVGGSDKMTLPFLAWGGALLAIAVVLLIVLPIPALIDNKAALKKSLFTLLGVAVLCIACYLFASPAMPSQSVLNQLGPGKEISGTMMRLTETGLYLAYFLVVISLCSLIGLSIYKSIKNR